MTALRPTAPAVIEEWARLVRAFEAQAQRTDEASDAGAEAFWQARVPTFRPGSSESEELEYLRSLAHPNDEWMDIGAGAGRLAIPLSESVRRVVTVDTSATMRSALAEGIAAAGRDNIEAIEARWPEDAGRLPVVDVTLAANMLYSVEAPVPFIEAMERHARRLCVIALADCAPRMPDPAVWEALHGEPLVLTPGARDLVTLMGALGRRVDVMTFPAPPLEPMPLDRAVARERTRYGLHEGSPREPELRALFQRHFRAEGDLVHIRSGRSYTAVVTWQPAA